MTMENELNDAINYLKRPIESKNDALLILSSLNLLNAIAKKKEYKHLINYGLIKPSVARFIQFCIENIDCGFIEELYYDSKAQCVYIRCFNIQFSFHNIGTRNISEEFLNSEKNRQVEWDGVRLQPIALELYWLSLDVTNNNICAEEVIAEKFRTILSKT
jgi:hypothetical protein